MCACMCVRVCVDVCVFVWISKMFATRWMCRWTHVNWRQCNICIQQSKNADSVRQSERGRKSVRRWEQEQDNTESECVCFCLRMCERANEREKWRFTQNRVSLRWNKKITQRTQRKIIYDEKIAHSSITSHVVAEQQRKHHIIYMYKNWKNAQVKKTTRKKNNNLFSNENDVNYNIREFAAICRLIKMEARFMLVFAIHSIYLSIVDGIYM